MRTRLAAAVLAVALAPSAAVGTGSGPAADSRWAAPVLISDSSAHHEISLVLSPTDPGFLAACAPSGVSALNGQSYFHSSRDGGQNWATMDVEHPATDTRTAAAEGGDCDVTFDDAGTLYAADTWLGNLSVGASRDGGRTWTGTALAVTAPIVDRPWLVGGPEGTVYLSYHDLQCCMPSAMWFTKSTDFGRTFAPAVPITTTGIDGAYVWEGNFVVAPNGMDIFLVYSRRVAPDLGLGTDLGMDLFLATSRDGGATWSSSPIVSLDRSTSSIYPSIGLDGGDRLHVVYSAPDLAANPVFWTTSDDVGTTWSTPIPLVTGATGHAPWVVGGVHAGEAAVAWLGSPDATTDEGSDWYIYASRVKVSYKGEATSVSTERTTSDRLFTGVQEVPEFEMVNLDAQGRMHIGMAVYREGGDGSVGWALYHQRELAVP